MSTGNIWMSPRVARLWETLHKMGLFVLPIFAAGTPETIDYLQVVADLPSFVQQGAQA